MPNGDLELSGQMLPATIRINGQEIPVNWMRFTWYSPPPPTEAELSDEALRQYLETGEMPTAEAQRKVYEVFTPVLPAQYATPRNMQTLWRNIYAMDTSTGEYHRMDFVEVRNAGIDWEDFQKRSTYFSLVDTLRGEEIPTELFQNPDIQDYIGARVNEMLMGQMPDIGSIWDDLTNIQAYSGYADELRATGKMGGEISPFYQDVTKARAMQEALMATKGEEFETERQMLEHEIPRLEKLATPWQERITAGVLDPMKLGRLEEQMGVAYVESLKLKQERLREITAAERFELAKPSITPHSEKLAAFDIAGPAEKPIMEAEYKPGWVGGGEAEQPKQKTAAEIQAELLAKARKRQSSEVQRRTKI